MDITAAQRRDSSDSVISNSSKASSLHLTTAAAVQPTVANRKGRSADPGSSQTNAERASISAPPPKSWRASLQQSARRPSVTLIDKSPFSELVRVQSRERNIPAIDVSDSVVSIPKLSPTTSFLRRSSIAEAIGLNPNIVAQQAPETPERNRQSFSSSILSLGSSFIAGTWGMPQSTASSMAGSETGDGKHHTAPL